MSWFVCADRLDGMYQQVPCVFWPLRDSEAMSPWLCRLVMTQRFAAVQHGRRAPALRGCAAARARELSEIVKGRLFVQSHCERGKRNRGWGERSRESDRREITQENPRAAHRPGKLSEGQTRKKC